MQANDERTGDLLVDLLLGAPKVAKDGVVLGAAKEGAPRREAVAQLLLHHHLETPAVALVHQTVVEDAEALVDPQANHLCRRVARRASGWT